ncbi:trehalose-phosphatase, partial [Acinetobacter baumannii]
MIKKYGQANMNNQSIISDGREKDTYFVTPND